MDPTPSDLAPADRRLGVRLRAGEPGAMAEVYDRHARAVYAIGRRATHSHHEAEEVVQQTFLQAWRSVERFDPGLAVGPWLATIARRVVIDRYRRAAVRPADPLEVERLPPVPDPTEGLALAWEVREALDSLPEAQREVLRMVHFDQLDQAEIARRLGVPVGTVKSRVHRAAAALRDRLGHLRSVPAAR